MPEPNAITDFAARREREARRFHARKPKRIADVVAQVITKRGYGRVQAIEDLDNAWRTTAGPALARFSRPGQLKRGVLVITASSSAVLQELNFQKQQILSSLNRQLPDTTIRDLRFRVGAIE